jgi:hypothetical protein
MLMTVKIYKSLGGRAARGQWSNSYEIDSDNAIGSPELDAEADKIIAFERAIHCAPVHFMRVVVSTFAKEGRAGHPEAVRVRELAGTGGAGGTIGGTTDENILPAEVVFEFKRIAATGRTGRLLYRGCLQERWVQTMGNGNFALDVGYAQTLGNVVTGWNNDATKPALVLASYGAGGAVLTRPVSRIEVGSVLIRKRTSRRKKKKTPTSETQGLQYMDEVLGLVAAAAAFFLTKNPTLSVGARTGAIATAGGIGQIIGNLIQTLTADPVDTDPGS